MYNAYVFNPKRIYPDFPLKSNHRKVKISILTPQHAICLCGVLHTAEIGSAVGGVQYTKEMMHTAETTLWNQNQIQKYFSLFIRGPSEKNGGQKSRDTLPLRLVDIFAFT